MGDSLMERVEKLITEEDGLKLELSRIGRERGCTVPYRCLHVRERRRAMVRATNKRIERARRSALDLWIIVGFMLIIFGISLGRMETEELDGSQIGVLVTAGVFSVWAIGNWGARR
ncbi:MAG: hypothetical protein ACE5FA_00100 [Dehalococcoidia bacterium]